MLKISKFENWILQWTPNIVESPLTRTVFRFPSEFKFPGYYCICLRSLMHKPILCRCNNPSSRLVIVYIFQISSVPACYEELTGGLEPIKKGKILWANNYSYWMRLIRPRRIAPSSISIILQMIRKPNSIIVLSFIHNNSYLENMAKTCLPPSIHRCWVHLRYCTFN